MVRKVKYEECYFKKKNLYLWVEELKEIHDGDIGKYQKEFYGNFYCPECFEGELAFYPNAITSHFKTKPSSAHNPNCSCNFSPASKKEIEEYCSDKKNAAAIRRKLKSYLELLAKEGEFKLSIITASGKNKKKFNYSTLEKGCVRKSIRKKKLSRSLDKSKDFDMPMIFYGSVIAAWDLRNTDVKYLRVRNIKTEELTCSIQVSKNIYGYLDKGMKFDEIKEVNIAFIATMKKKGNFNNCVIGYSTEIMLENRTT